MDWYKTAFLATTLFAVFLCGIWVTNLGCGRISQNCIGRLSMEQESSSPRTIRPSNPNFQRPPDSRQQDPGSDQRPSSRSDAHPRRRVVIHTRWRSGSSFVGALFANHPDVFYMFEPLCLFHILSGKLSFGGYRVKANQTKENWSIETQGIRYLFQLMQCNLRPYFELVTSRLGQGYRLVTNLLNRTFCHGEQPCDIDSLITKCRKSHVVAKIIRAENVAILEPLMRHLGVKVVHLVRDPRSTLLSRVKVTKRDSHVTDKNIQDILAGNKGRCENTQQDLTVSAVQVIRDATLRLFYVRVRFEDVATSPYNMTQRLYEFAGLGELRPSVLRFIQTSTNDTRQDGHPYSTKRNSRQVLQKWRLEMPWKAVQTVQSQCKQVMTLLHYTPAQDESMLRDLSLDLIGPDIGSIT